MLDGYRNQRSTVAISKAFEVEATPLDAFHRRSIDLEIKKSKIRSRLETEAKCKEIARRLTLYSMRFDSIKPLVKILSLDRELHDVRCRINGGIID